MQKRRLAVIILSVLLLAIVTTCIVRQSKPENEQNISVGSNNSIEESADEEVVTLDWYVNYSWFTTSWGDNVVSDAITSETGVDVNFIAPIGSESEKLNAMIATDSLPDVITLGYWEPQVNELIEKGMVYALNELADEYEPYFWDVADEEVVSWYTEEDGNIYAYPNSAVTPQDLEENGNVGSNQTFLVRKDIYEAIGSPDMSTPEGFKNAVIEAAQMYSEVDGEPLIPIGAHIFDGEGNVSFDKYLMNFLAIPWEKEGQYYDRYTDAEYVKWLKMFRELGEQGMLLPDIFVDSRTQMEEKLASGRYFCMIYQYTDMLEQQKLLYDKNPDMVYMAIEGPRNSNGEDPTLPSTGVNGWTVTMVSKQCKNPEKAIEFISYLMSEQGQLRTYLGVEGETYDIIDGEPIVKEEVRAILETDRREYDSKYGADNTYWMLQDNVLQQQWEQSFSPAEEQLKLWSRKYVVYSGQYEIEFANDTEMSVIDSRIKGLWSEVLPNLLLASSETEFDMILEEFVEQRDSYGYQSYMESATKQMNQLKDRLGLDK